MICRHCKSDLHHIFLDLGKSPPSNAYLSEIDLKRKESWYPLRVFVCSNCWLVQTEDYTCAEELFKHDYAYFSSTSSGWLQHAANYVKMITKRLGLVSDSFVIEIASNDGYLLKNFVASDIPCLGIEPTVGTAEAAEKLGIPVLREFFGARLAKRIIAEGKYADLIVGNNIFAHVPDINCFSTGLEIALKQGGVITLEFPHLMRIIEGVQFDTVYHEHFSYLSLHTAKRILQQASLRIWDVEELATHGGSLRVYACRMDDQRENTAAVDSMLDKEKKFGLCNLMTYRNFQQKVKVLKDNFLTFLLEQKKKGQSVIAYGAAAKGNTLLNYAGVNSDLLTCVCDAAASKQGKFLPGSHIPIVEPSLLKARKPDIVLVLPWNLAEEIISQHGYIRDWGGRFVIAVPELTYL